MKLMPIIIVAAFAFGMLSAFLSIQIFNHMQVDSDKPVHLWYDSFILTLAPGCVVYYEFFGHYANSVYEDTIDDEDILPAMLCNGLGWTVIVLILSSPILLLYLQLQKLRVPTAPSTTSG